jgi:hypothetical protein
MRLTGKRHDLPEPLSKILRKKHLQVLSTKEVYCQCWSVHASLVPRE